MRGLELVDDQGRVRAMLKVFRADPNVKIAAIEDGSAISLGGESNPTHIQIMARGTNTSLTLLNKDGQKRVIKPE